MTIIWISSVREANDMSGLANGISFPLARGFMFEKSVSCSYVTEGAPIITAKTSVATVSSFLANS